MAAKSQSRMLGKSPSQKSMVAKSQSKMLAPSPSPSQRSMMGKSESQRRMLAQKRKAPSRFQTCITSMEMKLFTVALTILLVLGAAAMYVLCNYEEGELAKLQGGVEQMRTFLASQNASYANESDQEVILEAIRQSEYLAEMNKNVAEASEEVDILIKLVDEGWDLKKEQFYFFSKEKMSFEMAMKFCGLQKALLVTEITLDKKLYIEYKLGTQQEGIWIGLWYKNDRWEWVNGQMLSGINYWAREEPKVNKNGTCVEFISQCLAGRCWFTADCHQAKPWICEKKPDPKYLG